MPISLPPITRRRFLGRTLAAAAAGVLLRGPASRGAGAAADEGRVDPNRFALLSDTHIAADPAAASRGIVMHDNLKKACDAVLALDKQPAAVLVNGDCAHLYGRDADYATLVGLLKPVREAGLPVHLALGNHDHRERIRAALPPAEAAAPPVADRQVLVIESPRANWFVLDSLDQTNRTPGALGEKQLAWLAGALDARAGKPALVMVHHDPDVGKKGKITGLTDTPALLDVLRPRRQVKALFYGHTHVWQVTREREDGLHLVNLPPVAYVFWPGNPSGWVDARVGDAGMGLELRCLNPQHPKRGDKHELAWRA